MGHDQVVRRVHFLNETEKARHGLLSLPVLSGQLLRERKTGESIDSRSWLKDIWVLNRVGEALGCPAQLKRVQARARHEVVAPGGGVLHRCSLRDRPQLIRRETGRGQISRRDMDIDESGDQVREKHDILCVNCPNLVVESLDCHLASATHAAGQAEHDRDVAHDDAADSPGLLQRLLQRFHGTFAVTLPIRQVAPVEIQLSREVRLHRAVG